MTLVEFLSKCAGVSNIQPVKITIGKRNPVTYDGAMYDDERWGRRIYVVGDLPQSYKRNSNTVYKFGLGTGDIPWFIAGYYNAEYLTKTKRPLASAEIQPFGDNFALALQEKSMESNNPRVVPMTIECN